MPVDITQLRFQVSQVTRLMQEALDSRERRIAAMRAVFDQDFDFAAWNRACHVARELQGLHWTGALFGDAEPVNHFFTFQPEPENYALIASDGSQIMPDRHKPVQYAAIQIASACIVYGHALGTQQLGDADIRSRQKPFKLMGEAEIYDDNSGDLISPGEISTERDLQEIEELATQCEWYRAAHLQPIAVADGSLVPFLLLNEVFVRGSSRRAGQILGRLVRALERMRACDAMVCGYIDRPNSNSVTRSCTLAAFPTGEPVDHQLLRIHIRKADQLLRGVMDRQLLEGVLPSGQRTALFEPQWLINSQGYLGQAGHSMRACYLNIGSTRPNLIRLEMPTWCADADRVGIVAKVMERHASMGGGYPICLKAAHEEARLSMGDEQRIDQVMERALMDQGILALPSAKQEAKERR